MIEGDETISMMVAGGDRSDGAESTSLLVNDHYLAAPLPHPHDDEPVYAGL